MTTHIDISIGPVQGFVAQSHKTRDLWGSSYLLSVLAAHAMVGAREAGGTILRPRVDFDHEPLLRQVLGHVVTEPPQVGSVPNHFVVDVADGTSPSMVAHAATHALCKAWTKVTDAVWETFVEDVCLHGEGTREIWNRQVGRFWEIVWVAGPPGADLLRRRKYWRSHQMPDEPGDKCMVMPQLQELSGHVAASGRSQREAQQNFWRQLCCGPRLGPLDLDRERLSSIALVKRLYPKIALQALGWALDTSHWPSTVYIGALPWIQHVAATVSPLASAYAEQVQGLVTGAIAEVRPTLAGSACDEAGDFARLDANHLHVSYIEDPRLCPLDRAASKQEKTRGRITLLEQLREIQDSVASPPPVFYALLLADGDELGKLVVSLGADRVGEALAAFTDAVPNLVRESYGVTIYTGGDDVMAMLPVAKALECARALSRRYAHEFKRVAPDAKNATLSAAVTFAHVRLQLRTVLSESHRLLDEVAKKDNGRNSLAVGVLKRGGLHCQWATRWKRRGDVDAVEQIGQLAQRLRGDRGEADFSATLLHRLHDTLGVICGWPRWLPGGWATALAEIDMRAFLAAEVRRSLQDRTADKTNAGVEHNGKAADVDKSTDEITRLLVELIRHNGGALSSVQDTEARVGIDALLLARFLARGGALEMDQ